MLSVLPSFVVTSHPSSPSSPQGSATMQSSLWSQRAKDWAEIQEPQCRALYIAVLQTLSLPRGTNLLDVGCGSGVFCELAAHRGISVAGLDASEAQLEFARSRVPQATFVVGELEQLSFPDAEFDVITGFNSFQLANSPARALAEAYRVLRPGGQLIFATWAMPGQQASIYLQTLADLLPTSPSGAPGPFALSCEGTMARLAFQVGFEVLSESEVTASWDYPDQATALRGLLSSGPAVNAMQKVGEAAVTRAVSTMLMSFRQSRGGFRLENRFRFVIAEKRAARTPTQSASSRSP